MTQSVSTSPSNKIVLIGLFRQLDESSFLFPSPTSFFLNLWQAVHALAFPTLRSLLQCWQSTLLNYKHGHLNMRIYVHIRVGSANVSCNCSVQPLQSWQKSLTVVSWSMLNLHQVLRYFFKAAETAVNCFKLHPKQPQLASGCIWRSCKLLQGASETCFRLPLGLKQFQLASDKISS